MTVAISLGAGVQSTALALMAAHRDPALGDVADWPTVAIFADTGWEPAATYEHLEQLEVALRIAPHPIDVVRVTAGNIRHDYTAGLAGRRFASIPVYVARASDGREAMLRRQCTREYKLEPILRELRGRGATAKTPADVWVGISLDEFKRMKPSRVKYAVNRHPLIDAELTRARLELWLAEHWPVAVPKSACIGCPYHTDQQWRDLRDNRPDEWADAIEFDRAIRQLPRIEGEAFLHRQLVPLDEVDLSTLEDHGQLGFDEECEGMCGV